LLIGTVISSLCFSPGCVSRTACRRGSGNKATAGADCSSGGGFAGGSADYSTQPGTHCGPHRRATGQILIDDFIRRHLNPSHGPLSANRVIGLEFLKRLARLWQHHDAWSRRHRRAAAQHDRSKT
jgi:hypothetical protein